MSAFWKRQLLMLEGLLLALTCYGIACILSSITGWDLTPMVAGGALYLACAAYVRSAKP